MGVVCRNVVLALTLAVLSSMSAFALPQDTPATAGESSQEATPQVDLLDVWHSIRHKPEEPEKRPEAQGLMIAAAPKVCPNVGFHPMIGAAAQVAWVAGDPTKTRISSSVTSLSFSSKGYTLFSARFDLFSSENEWLVEGDNRYYNAAQNVYGLGTDTPASAVFNTKYRFVRVRDTVYRHVRNSVYLGGGLLFDSHSDVGAVNAAADPSTSAYVTYSQAHGLPLDSQQSSGISANVLIDRRVGEIDPRDGWLVNAFYRMSFEGFLGGDSGWQLAHLEFRHYIPLADRAPEGSRIPARHRLAIWTYGDLVTKGAPPYFELPATVMDKYGRSSRAYQEGRYRGERLVYGEVEYRGMLRQDGLLGMVAFVNTTTVTNLEAGEKLFDSFAPAAGGGLRVLFNKRSRTNFCIDAAFGKAGAKGFYFAIQDAF